jgi:hypothetical protein
MKGRSFFTKIGSPQGHPSFCAKASALAIASSFVIVSVRFVLPNVELWGGKCDSIYPSHTCDLLCCIQLAIYNETFKNCYKYLEKFLCRIDKLERLISDLPGIAKQLNKMQLWLCLLNPPHPLF